MELAVGLLHERHPKLIGVRTLGKQEGLLVWVVGQQCIDHHLPPLSILEELEGNEPKVFEVLVINNQTIKEVPLRRYDYDGPNQPTLAQCPLLGIPLTIYHELHILRYL